MNYHIFDGDGIKFHQEYRLLKKRMVYTNGSISAPKTDWRTMRMTTQADSLDFVRLLCEECRKRDVTYFANDGYIMTPYKDIILWKV